VDWTIATGDVTLATVDALALPIVEGTGLSPVGVRVDQALDGGLTSLLADTAFQGKANTVRTVYTFGRLPARFLILVGLGTATEPSVEQVRRSAASAARAAREAGAKSLAVAVPAGMAAGDAGQAVAEGVLLGTYRYTRYKSSANSDGSKALQAVHLYVDEGAEEAGRQGVERGEAVAAGVAFARDLVNQPGADLWPERLATIAATMAGEAGLACHVYDERALADLGAGALLGVGHGSERPPRLIHLRYRPDGVADGAPITFVGKGITFDTGGYSIKTAGGMETMKCDMAGAAAVLGAIHTIARLQPPVAIDAVIASAENMVSGRSMRPGDVLTSMSGKTIEVNNTDAEGRLVLADALTFAIRQGATEMIDLATLTGACVVALGTVAVGVMGNQQPIINRLLAAAAAEGERMWQLPLYDEYREGLRSDIADMRNSGGRYAGAQIGASFLKDFAGDTPWVHLDIAGPAWLDKETPLSPKGASGVGVRTLIRYAEEAARR
jgi:leucyl aminopeptidase